MNVRNFPHRSPARSPQYWPLLIIEKLSLDLSAAKKSIIVGVLHSQTQFRHSWCREWTRICLNPSLESQAVQPLQCLFLWKTLFLCKDIFTCFSTDFHNVSTRFLINRCNLMTTLQLITNRASYLNSLKLFYFLNFVFQPLAIFFHFFAGLSKLQNFIGKFNMAPQQNTWR